jgi:hypothetical protein
VCRPPSPLVMWHPAPGPPLHSPPLHWVKTGAAPSPLPFFLPLFLLERSRAPPLSPSTPYLVQATGVPLPSLLHLGEPCLQAISHRMNPPTFPLSPLCCRTPLFPSLAAGELPLPSSTTALSLFSTSPSTHRYGEPPVSSPCPSLPQKPLCACRQHLIDDRPSSGCR